MSEMIFLRYPTTHAVHQLVNPDINATVTENILITSNLDSQEM